MSRRIINILMERDGLDYEEAKEQVRDVKEMMAECDYDPLECEDILEGELGLEMDYLFDLLL